MNEKTLVKEGYNLGLDTFSTRPDNSLIVPQYKGLATVTRLNWTAFLINNFAMGRADWGRQKAHFTWFEARTGFDWESSVRSFLMAGGWNIMIPAERDLFLEIFKRVGKHHLDQFKAEPKIRLDGQLMRVMGANILYFTKRHNLAGLDEDQLKVVMDEGFYKPQ